MDYNTKITEIEGKIPSVTSLATTTTLNPVKNKIQNIKNILRYSKYQSLDILPHLIIINLQMKYTMQR